MNIEDLRYSKDHVWVRIEQGNLATIGITLFAQESMGEITYVELPEIGKDVEQGQFLCSIGSAKALVDLPSPISGKVAELNDAIGVTPGLVNTSPYNEGWFIRLKTVKIEEINSLMDNESYLKFIESENK